MQCMTATYFSTKSACSSPPRFCVSCSIPVLRREFLAAHVGRDRSARSGYRPPWPSRTPGISCGGHCRCRPARRAARADGRPACRRSRSISSPWPALPAFDPSPEAEACRRAFVALLAPPHRSPPSQAISSVYRSNTSDQCGAPARCRTCSCRSSIARYMKSNRASRSWSRKTRYGCVDVCSITPRNDAIRD